MYNLAQLYFKNEKQVPFIVRRETWNSIYGIVVLEIKVKKTKNGWFPFYTLGYGIYGGKDYWGTKENPKEISCSGCYLWEIVKPPYPEEWNIPEDIKK